MPFIALHISAFIWSILMRVLTRISIAFVPALLLAANLGCAATAARERTGGYVDDSAITAKVQTAQLNVAGVKSVENDMKVKGQQ
jgi:hypothetical protein